MVRTIDSEWLKNELLDTQRWEDEGGQMIENILPMPDRLSPLPVPINTPRHGTSLQWNERLIIEPFLPGHGSFLIGKKHTTKTD